MAQAQPPSENNWDHSPVVIEEELVDENDDEYLPIAHAMKINAAHKKRKQSECSILSIPVFFSVAVLVIVAIRKYPSGLLGAFQFTNAPACFQPTLERDSTASTNTYTTFQETN